MAWHTNRRAATTSLTVFLTAGTAFLTAGTALFLTAGPAWADLVVIRAKGGGVKPGQVVPPGFVITLPAASNATLLSRDGQTITLTGPFSGPVTEPGGGSGGDNTGITMVSRLLAANTADTSTLGVTRAVAFSDPHAINFANGTHCHFGDEMPKFIRAAGSPPDRLTVSGASGVSQSLVWPKNEAFVTWPNSVALTNGIYTLRLASEPNPVTLALHLVPRPVQAPGSIAIWMAEHQCPTQAAQLLSTLR